MELTVAELAEKMPVDEAVSAGPPMVAFVPQEPLLLAVMMMLLLDWLVQVVFAYLEAQAETVGPAVVLSSAA
jgi:hypothetical protein